MTKQACTEKKAQLAKLMVRQRSMVIHAMGQIAKSKAYSNTKYKGRSGINAVFLHIQEHPYKVEGEICPKSGRKHFRCQLLKASFLTPKVMKLNIEAHDKARKRVKNFFRN